MFPLILYEVKLFGTTKYICNINIPSRVIHYSVVLVKSDDFTNNQKNFLTIYF